VEIKQNQPPCDLAAEQGVLGGALIHGNEVMAAVSSVLEYGDFFDRRHAAVYLAMDQLFDRGEPVDEITVTSYLRDQGKLAEVGGEVFLAELADAVLGPLHVEHYAQLVRKKAELRQIAAAAAQARSIALNPGMDPDVALAEAERLLMASRDRVTRGRLIPMAEVLPRIAQEFEERRKSGKDPNALPTGFRALDKQLGGGMRPGDLVIGAGRPGMGKTSFGLSVALNVAVRQGKTVLIVSREQRAEQLAGLMLCSLSGVSTQAWRSGRITPMEMANLDHGRRRLQDAPVFFYHDSRDMGKIRTHARILKARNALALVILDYVQLFAQRQTAELIGEVSRNLKALAMDLGVPILALSQINREVSKRDDPKPHVEDLKGSGNQEEDADVVLLFFRPGCYSADADRTLAQVSMPKQRGGPVGAVNLLFRPEFTRFEDMEADHGLFDQDPADRAVA